MNTEKHKISVRKNDTVQVISGQFKGVTGKILSVDRANARVTVENEKLKMKKHVKATQQNPGGGITLIDRPLHVSKVLLFCGKCNKGVRHGVKLSGKGKDSKKVRTCKKCDGSLEQKI